MCFVNSRARTRGRHVRHWRRDPHPSFPPAQGRPALTSYIQHAGRLTLTPLPSPVTRLCGHSQECPGQWACEMSGQHLRLGGGFERHLHLDASVLGLLIYLYFFFFFFSLVYFIYLLFKLRYNLQCYISFRCTAKWFSYTYVYVYSFSDSFSL